MVCQWRGAEMSLLRDVGLKLLYVNKTIAQASCISRGGGGSDWESSTSQPSLLQPERPLTSVQTYAKIFCLSSARSVGQQSEHRPLPRHFLQRTHAALGLSGAVLYTTAADTLWCKVMHLFYKGERGSRNGAAYLQRLNWGRIFSKVRQGALVLSGKWSHNVYITVEGLHTHQQGTR